jgi:hypothetical protein
MKIDKELAVGVFLVIGIFSLVFISVKLGRLEVLERGDILFMQNLRMPEELRQAPTWISLV